MVGKDEIEYPGVNRSVGYAKELLDGVIQYLRDSVGKIEEPKGEALFETAAEVLIGLKTAFEHYQNGTEPALRQSATAPAPRNSPHF